MGHGKGGRGSRRRPGRLGRHVLTTRALRALVALVALLVVLGAVPVVVAAAPASPDTTKPTTPDFRVERSFGRFGVGPGELSAPQGVAIDPKGRILVADTGNHRIARFDSSGAYLDQFGGFGGLDDADASRFDRPTEIVAGGSLSLWVLDRGNARVVKFDLEGRPVGVVVDLRADGLRERLGTVDPGGLSADAGGRLLVTDTAEDRVIEFDPLGAVVSTHGGFGPQEGRFADPSGVAIGARGGAWIADPGNRRVQRFDASGAFVRAVALDVTMKGERGLAVAAGPDGVFAVADAASGRIVLYADDGTVLARHVPRNKADLWASGVAIDGAGRVVVADARHHRVTRLARNASAP